MHRAGLLVVLCGALLGLTPVTAGAAAGNWALTQLPARTVGEGFSDQVGLNDVSCPDASLCVAVGGFDTVVSSRSPTAGAGSWHVVTPPAPEGPGECREENAMGESFSCGLNASLRAVSCATENLCVAVSWEGFAYVSTNPAGGASAWSSTDLNEASGGDIHLSSVSCPSASLCVAVSTGQNRSGSVGGRIFATTDPASGNWREAQLDSSLAFTSVSCGGPSLCVAVAEDGRIAVSSEPRGGASAWHVAGGPAAAGGLGAVGCARSGPCVAGDDGGNLLVSASPEKAGSTWSVTKGGGLVLITGVDCTGASDCAAVDNNGDVITSTNSAAGEWNFENLIPFHESGLEGEANNALFGVSCGSPSLCVLVGSSGRIFTSTKPFPVGGAGPGASSPRRSHKSPLRPRTFFRWKEMSWHGAVTRRRHVRADFHFYTRTARKGFECSPDRGRWRRCRSPLRYWVGHGHHELRVRAIGPTGLRGPATKTKFKVGWPRRGGIVVHMRRS